MNIPLSSIEPFGITGIPQLKYGIPKFSHNDILDQITEDTTWWCKTFTAPLSIGEQLIIQRTAKDLGATYTNVRSHDNRDGGYTFSFILNGRDYSLELVPA